MKTNDEQQLFENEATKDMKVTDNSEIKFVLKKAKSLDDELSYNVELNVENQKLLLNPSIKLRKRYIFIFEDWFQPRKNLPVYRFMIPDYKSELKSIYQSLSNHLKDAIKEEKFLELSKKLNDKEDKNFYEMRFAFRKEESIKAFVFYCPNKIIKVQNYMGFRIPILRSWYVDDLYKTLGMSGHEKIESRATDDGSYMELEEMGYYVEIIDVNDKEVINDPKAFINSLINLAFKEECEDKENLDLKIFDLAGYQSTITRIYNEAVSIDGGKTKIKLPDNFEELLLIAYKDYMNK